MSTTDEPYSYLVKVGEDWYDVYIGRNKKHGDPKWGNPFIMGRDGNRDAVIEKYEEWIKTQPELLAALPELKGKILGCHCVPQKCHGEVLLRLLDQIDFPVS